MPGFSGRKCKSSTESITCYQDKNPDQPQAASLSARLAALRKMIERSLIRHEFAPELVFPAGLLAGSLHAVENNPDSAIVRQFLAEDMARFEALNRG